MRWCCQRLVTPPTTSRKRHAFVPSSARINFAPGTRVHRGLFAILRSIWLNEIRSQRIRERGGLVDAEDALTTDGAREIEMNITASAVVRAIDRLPEAQRETILLVYGEGYSYAEAAGGLGLPPGAS